MGTQNLLKASCFILSILITACGQGPSQKSFKTAPQTQEELGLLVQGLNEDQVQQIIDESPEATYRPISKILKSYELRGVTKDEVLQVAPQAQVEENRFLKEQSWEQPQKIDLKLLSRTSDLYETFSPESCPQTNQILAPEIEKTKVKGHLDRAYASVGEEFRFTKSFRGPQDSRSAWIVLPPQGSKIKSEIIDSPDLNLVPDMPGRYEVALVYRREDRCGLSELHFYVTFNEEYKEETSDYDLSSYRILSEKTFSHLENININDDFNANLPLLSQKEVVAAVIDSGVNYNHPCLKKKMWINEDEVPGDGIDNDGNGFIDDRVGYDMVFGDSMPMDDQGHGSHVAGLLAGDYMGSAQAGHVKIMALKAGSGSKMDLGSYLSSLDYAISNGAHIINLSVGDDTYSSEEKALLEEAQKRGILIVAAAGNGDKNGYRVNNDNVPNYPSSYDLDNIISVASSTYEGKLANYSNYGARSVDIAAPGGYYEYVNQEGGRKLIPHAISSAYIRNPRGSLLNLNIGTSMSSPLVAGAAALIKSISPNLEPKEVIEILKSTGKRSANLKDKVSSSSVLDVRAALSHASSRDALLF